MSYLQAAVLGLIQGLTEILPISSSAHLVIVPWMLRWPYQGLAYDVALHWGTLLALAAVFWKDWARLLAAAARREDCQERRLFWGIVWATVPGALAGLLLERRVESVFHRPDRIAWMLAAFGVLLGAADRWGRRARGMDSLDLKSCLWIGAAQALALVPGVSRSGITITAGLILGLKREDAARFSFLLSMPIVLAAGALKLRHLDAAAFSGPFWAGVLVSAAVGYAAIRLLLGYVRTRDLGVFVFYRLSLGALILFLYNSQPGPLRERLLQADRSLGMNAANPSSPVAQRLKRHVQVLAGEIGERNPYEPKALEKARAYIQDELKRLGYSPQALEYKSRSLYGIPDGTAFYNVEIEVPAVPSGTAGAWVIGAHYDSAPGTPGADDNASGVAVLLELARAFKEKPPAHPLKLVAFSTEEPPSFGNRNMGSWHYARKLQADGVRLEGMISLEMLGYYNPAPGSQNYPPFLSWFYPDTGGFIGIVGNLKSRGILKRFARSWRAGSDFPLETAALPAFVSAITLSDHYNFWDAGYPALMMTDTAFFRNPHYHEPTDTPEKLDYGRMARVSEGLAEAFRR